MPLALPTPRFVLRGFGWEWLYHYAPLPAFEGGIITRVTGRPGDWTDCLVAIRSSSGWTGGRLMRDYSVVDFELKLRGRGTYTYFFGEAPSEWGLRKNLGATTRTSSAEQGLGIVRVRLDDLLAVYDGPVFCRPDDRAVVIRGIYEGPGQVMPLPVGLRAPTGP